MTTAPTSSAADLKLAEATLSRALPLSGDDSGVMVDRFRLVGVIAEDAFVVVYRALDTGNGNAEVVAEEYFPTSLAVRGDDRFSVVPQNRRRQKPLRVARERFEAEGSMIASFDGGAVPVCHGVFHAFETAWRISDPASAASRSVRDWIEQDQTALDDAQVRGILATVLPVLGEVHRVNALHRAVTPDHILLDGAGVATLTGFGAARYMIAEKAEALRDVLEPGFAPFEFLQRRDHQGPNSDLYSLGATLYYAMTGVVPASAVDRFEAAQHRDNDPLIPLATLARSTHSDDLIATVEWMLALRVQDRPMSATAVHEHLEASEMPSVLLSVRAGEVAEPTEAVAAESLAASKLVAHDQARRSRRRVTAAVVVTGFCVAVFGFGGMKLVSPVTVPASTSATYATQAPVSVVPQPVRPMSSAVESMLHAARDAMREGRLMDASPHSALVLLERALGEEPDNTLAQEGINHMLHFFVEEKQRAESASDGIGIRLVNRNLRRIRLRHPESRAIPSAGFYAAITPRQRIGAITAGSAPSSQSRDFVN